MDSRLLGLIDSCAWQDAWGEFERLYSADPNSPRLMLMGSHIAFGQKDFFRARHLAEQALRLWDSAHPPVLLGKIRFHLGMISREIGDTHVALEQFRAFLSELPVLYPGLSMGEGKAYFYLALTLRQRRDLDSALPAYQAAVACFRRDGLPSLLCRSLQNLAWLLCAIRQPAQARGHLLESEGLMQTTEERIHQTLGEAYLAVVETRYAEAAVLCESIFRRVDRGEPVSAEERSQSAWIAATAALAQGNSELASALADIALEYGSEARDSRLINDAAALRREIRCGPQRDQTAS